MLLPELLHLPAILLLVMVLMTGVALPTAVPLAAGFAHASGGRWLAALAIVLGALVGNSATWFAFRAARKAAPTRFLGFSSRLWSIGIPLSYLAGVGFGVYLCVLFYS